jgi:hypothetical protein
VARPCSGIALPAATAVRHRLSPVPAARRFGAGAAAGDGARRDGGAGVAGPVAPGVAVLLISEVSFTALSKYCLSRGD